MKLIALLAGLLIERLATQLFHLRQLRWLDAIIDAGFRYASKAGVLPALVAVAGIAFVLVLPLLLLLVVFGDLVYGIAYLLIAVVVLFFSLGPKDIGEQVDEYCAALERDDDAAVQSSATALLERAAPEDRTELIHRVEEAVCVQANNRLFAVIFWFILLGPLGAWAYRSVDLIRRRAVFTLGRAEAANISDEVGDTVTLPEGLEGDVLPESDARAMADAASTLHGWVVWIPARLTALGYALAGNFDAAIGTWRGTDAEPGASIREQSERLLARVGTAALAIADKPGESDAARGIRGAMAANGLVFRLLGIWAVIIAAMTLYGWSV